MNPIKERMNEDLTHLMNNRGTTDPGDVLGDLLEQPNEREVMELIYFGFWMKDNPEKSIIDLITTSEQVLKIAEAESLLDELKEETTRVSN